MLEDHKRTGAYYKAVMSNKRQFAGKVVLDVGTGSGILAIFAAKAGARKVYAVEATSIATSARTLIAHNKVGKPACVHGAFLSLSNPPVTFKYLPHLRSPSREAPHHSGLPIGCLVPSPLLPHHPPGLPPCPQLDHIIEVIQGTIESIELPEKVDIIISEWMGYFLLRESMLDSVLVARDKFLKPGGALYPSHANMYMTAIQSHQAQQRLNEFHVRGEEGELWADGGGGLNRGSRGAVCREGGRRGGHKTGLCEGALHRHVIWKAVLPLTPVMSTQVWWLLDYDSSF